MVTTPQVRNQVGSRPPRACCLDATIFSDPSFASLTLPFLLWLWGKEGEGAREKRRKSVHPEDSQEVDITGFILINHSVPRSWKPQGHGKPATLHSDPQPSFQRNDVPFTDSWRDGPHLPLTN